MKKLMPMLQNTVQHSNAITKHSVTDVNLHFTFPVKILNKLSFKNIIFTQQHLLPFIKAPKIHFTSPVQFGTNVEWAKF